MVKEHLFNGSALAAQNGHVILSQGYGLADQEKKNPNTGQTKFRIAQNTWQFTAMAIMMLQEQGKLHVQDKICTYLTDCPEAWQPITLHQLLTHTSGIPDGSDSFYTRDFTSSVPLEQMIADAKTKPLDSQLGEKFSYDNMGYILLGKIIEAVSGQKYEAFLQKNIFKPLQMSNTGYDPNRDDVAAGYRFNDNQAVADPINWWLAFSSAGLYSTVEDLYRWDQALHTSKLVPQQVLDTVFKSQVTDSNGWGYGYGWSIAPIGQQRIIQHYAGIDGFSTAIKRYPDDRATIIIQMYMQDIDPDTISNSFEKKLFGK